ncbi:uncharacterized protein FRV6_00010 [Fusarium oxysporum]|uniref:Uncharacterized protein n=1 Tax=Fusarium oxysporum TaxID=5507 RepID=A0A2H3SGW2_FUSOX|nr:uncharacterized protein FRV6_00010 [Fusarium oxysporum]
MFESPSEALFYTIAIYGAYFTALYAMQLVDRVPHRLSLLLFPFVSILVLRQLHGEFLETITPSLRESDSGHYVIALTSIVIITYTLITCFGCQHRGPQIIESQIARPAALLPNSQDYQEYEDNSRDGSDVTMASDIPLKNSTGNHLKMLPSHNSTTRNGRNSPTYPWVKGFNRLFNYQMAVTVWCIMIVYAYLPQDIYLLASGSQYAEFLLTEDGIIGNAFLGILGTLILWLMMIPKVYMIRWFVLPVLYFLMAVVIYGRYGL